MFYYDTMKKKLILAIRFVSLKQQSTSNIYFNNNNNKMMNILPKSITWTGHGKSRLSIMTYPSALEEELLVDELNTEECIEELHSSHSLIRSPTSIKNYKRSQPVLIVRKRSPVSFEW